MTEDRVPHYKIMVNGSQLPDEVFVDVLSVTVSQYIAGSDVFTIELNNWHSDRQDYKWLDNSQFEIGSEIEIKLGYIDNIKSLIKGEVTAIEPEFQAEMAPTLKVQGYDRLHRFRRGRKTRSFLEAKDSQIAEQMARELKLQAQTVDTQVIHPYLFQNNQTNIDFLLERARRIRYEVDVENRTLIFRPAANDHGKNVSLAFGEKLKSFFPRLTTLGQVSEVVVQGWNPTKKEAIKGQARAGDEITKMQGTKTGTVVTENAFGAATTVIADKYIFSQTEAEQIAKAKYNEMILEFITGEGKAIGNPELKAGEVIELTRLGKRFSGSYYLTAVTHVINQTGYLTNFCVQRNAI